VAIGRPRAGREGLASPLWAKVSSLGQHSSSALDEQVVEQIPIAANCNVATMPDCTFSSLAASSLPVEGGTSIAQA